MSKPISASDRSALIKLAADLPKGSEERKAILAGLKVAKVASVISAQDFDGMRKGQRVQMDLGTNLMVGKREFEVGRTTYSKKYDVYSKALYPIDENDQPVTSGIAKWTLFKRPEGVSLAHGNMGTVVKTFRKVGAKAPANQEPVSKKTLIRFASTLPKGSDERRAILAGIAKAGKMLNAGDTLERQDYRIHRYVDSLHLTDLTNAGKRGKKVQELWVSWWRGSVGEGNLLSMLHDWFEFATRAPSFKALAATIETGLSELKSEGTSVESGWNTHRGVDVMPGGFKKLTIHTDEFYLSAEYDGFRVKDMQDRYNEPTCISRGGKKDIKQFYRWVKDNESKLKRMTFQDVIRSMRDEGIDYHYYCAMD